MTSRENQRLAALEKAFAKLEGRVDTMILIGIAILGTNLATLFR